MRIKNTKFIIITSIFEPTKAVIDYSAMKDWTLIVVGDKKTPGNWNCDNVIYLSPEKQQELAYNIIPLLPWNHYGRKMIGYLYAIENGAEIIVDTDDDNIPLDNWDILSFSGKFKSISVDGFLNIYKLYTNEHVWPRGYPLMKITTESNIDSSISNIDSNVGVWQFLANNDPDVDAIYRVTNNKPIIFNDSGPIVLEKGTICPFNSQNTVFTKALFPLLYLPAFVTFRFTDILRSFVAQPIMWNHDYKLGFSNATVTQNRNPHDYLKDFESEIPMYLHTENAVEIASTTSMDQSDIYKNLLSVYENLEKQNIVSAKELLLVKAWIKDLKRLSQERI